MNLVKAQKDRTAKALVGPVGSFRAHRSRARPIAAGTSRSLPHFFAWCVQPLNDDERQRITSKAPVSFQNNLVAQARSTGDL